MLDVPQTMTIESDHPAAVVDSPVWHNGQLVRELLDQLPVEQRQLVELAFFQGYTHRELAAVWIYRWGQ